MPDKKIKIVMTGGGSGGHIFPLIAVFETIKNDYEVLFIGQEDKNEREIIETRGIKFKGIVAGKWRRYLSWRNLLDPFKVIIGFWQSFFILLSYKPKAVLAKGGFVSVPVCLAAWILRIPIVAHESDAVMGLANRVVSRIASRIAVAFPVGRYNSIWENKMVWAGMPIRSWRADLKDEDKMRKAFSIDNDLPVVFVTGGSYGAMNLNTYIMRNIVDLLEFCNVIHQAGSNDFKRVEAKKINIVRGKGKYLIYDFMPENWDQAMVIADLLVSRAGSTTLSEISSLSKPSIQIPLPSSASNHQFYNAKSFEDVGASIMIEERDFDKINLAVLIKSIFEDEERYHEMKSASATAMKTEGSAQIIADILEELIEKK